jgi:flagellar basal-body rod modification protein FlgD
MSPVDNIGSALSQAIGTGTGTGTAAPKQSSAQLNQNEFLTLMVTQLKNQNPLSPMDPTQFVGQLAQFSTVTGIENMQGSITNLVDSMKQSQVLGGTNLIGHGVLAPATTATIAGGGTVSGAATVPAGTTSLQVNVLDSGGQLVRTFAVAPQNGLTNFTWDGLNSTGSAAAAGQYSFQVVAGAGGTNTSLAPSLVSRVNSVSIDPTTQALTLNTNNGPIALSSVLQVM